MTQDDLERELCRLLGVSGPKFGSTLDGYVIFDAPGGGNVYVPFGLSPQQRLDLLKHTKAKFKL